jgi:hypothetical protein
MGANDALSYKYTSTDASRTTSFLGITPTSGSAVMPCIDSIARGRAEVNISMDDGAVKQMPSKSISESDNDNAPRYSIRCWLDFVDGETLVLMEGSISHTRSRG